METDSILKQIPCGICLLTETGSVWEQLSMTGLCIGTIIHDIGLCMETIIHDIGLCMGTIIHDIGLCMETIIHDRALYGNNYP